MESIATKQVVESYHAQRSAGIFSGIEALLAKDFHFESPLMRFENTRDHLEAVIDFHQVVKGYDMISALFGENEAILVYELRTITPVAIQPTAEYFHVIDGKIDYIKLIFDASPWQAVMGAMQQAR